MKITYSDQRLNSIKGDFLTFAYDTKNTEIAESFLTRFGGKALRQQKKRQEFKNEPGKTLLVVSEKSPVQFCYTEVMDMSADHLTNTARNWGAHARAQSERAHAQHVSVFVESFFDTTVAQAWMEGFLLAGYQYNQYKSKKQTPSVKRITLHISPEQKSLVQKGFTRAQHVVHGVTLTRDLVNTPAHDMTPSKLAETAHKIAALSKDHITATVYSEVECAEMGMNSYLAVAKGSTEPPKFIHLVYKPTQETKKRVAIVGKGVTFDSGGLSIKPSQGMEDMKCDMAGAATVLGLFSTLVKLDIPVEVHGVIAATENMPSGHAIRPGDIVTASNGTTIEILNTDAEGRLTLADALVYIQKHEPDAVIDLATLTGACMVALGEEIAAMYANDDQLAQDLKQSAHATGEPLWRMPLHATYDKLIESKVADIRNISTVPYGGSITAAMFLQRFINKGQVWAHLDIAGPAFASKPLNAYTQYGASGYGVATLIHYLETPTSAETAE